MAKILITGGAGYIGSHTCVELLNAGHDVIVFDNLSNSSEESLRRVQKLANRSLVFVQGDIRDANALDQLFKSHEIEAVIHFAGLKAVGESQEKPLIYFDNNIAGSIQLVKAMEKAGIFTLVFSSSATVYDEVNISPLNENMPTGMPSNNYGYTKLIVEQLLQKLSLANPKWSIALLRYFNPAGESSFMTEVVKGASTYYLTSDKSTMSYRTRIRTPTFTHLQQMPSVINGSLVSDLIIYLATIDVVMADVDR